ncbi:MAG: FAD-dependent thymidylate synthase [Desulfobacteraceae bacterium]|nr:FAD-dependent thymidylate synthase [Desulfobacteraceae bacterium]
MEVQFVRSAVSPYGMAPSDETSALRLIEVCGRTAYKSEDKITGDSARKFVLMLKSHGHLSVLEHSNIVLQIETHGETAPFTPVALLSSLKDRMGFHRVYNTSSGLLVAGNIRAWLETLEHLKRREPALCGFFAENLNRYFPNLFEPGSSSLPLHASLVGEEAQLALAKSAEAPDLPVFVFRFVCDRGITHEVVRHRVFSFTQESTRYVNYKNKGMVLILPEELEPFYNDETGGFPEGVPIVSEWKKRAELLFDWYTGDLARGLRPEIARDILPNLLKSEIFVSGRWSGWKHFILLRDSAQAHPRIHSIAREVRAYFEGFGLTC